MLLLITTSDGALIVPYLKKHFSAVLPVVQVTLFSEQMNLSSARLLQTLEHSSPMDYFPTFYRSFPFETAQSVSHMQDMHM